MTISNAHRKALRKKHELDPNFGVVGYLWAPRIASYLEEIGARSYLDYGCGRSRLMEELSNRHDYTGVEEYKEYDPVFHRFLPTPADFVSCIDVLEHVEMDQLEAVLQDLKRVTLKAGLISISLRNSSPAGRRTHPIVQPREWWLTQIKRHFPSTVEVPILNPEKAKSEVAILVRAT